jgi:hypothetical protein
MAAHCTGHCKYLALLDCTAAEIKQRNDRIEELEAALTDIRDARPVKLADGLVSSPQELVVQMQQRADRALYDNLDDLYET